MKNNFTTEPFVEKVGKPWGHELIYTRKGSPFCGKIIFIKAGFRWSFQYHDQKTESFCLLDGEAEIWIENSNGSIEKMKMEKMKGYLIAPEQKHRVIAVSDCRVVESSTPETGNTLRIEDDFKRDTETEEIRGQTNRGWKNN